MSPGGTQAASVLTDKTWTRSDTRRVKLGGYREHVTVHVPRPLPVRRGKDNCGELESVTLVRAIIGPAIT